MAIQSPLYYYLDSVSYTAVAAWTALTAYTVGQVVRQLAAPALANERCFVCIIAGTSLAAEPSWSVSKGAKTAEAAGPTWQEITGRTALNGNNTNTPTWPINTNPGLGYIIKNTANTHYFIVSTTGTTNAASEPVWNTATGATTTDNAATWTCLGAIGSFTTAFAAPWSRLLNAVNSSLIGAGDWLYVGDDHAETQASPMAVVYAGSATVLTTILCIDHTKAVPTAADLKTTATVSTTVLNSNITITGSAYVYGLKFQPGTDNTDADVYPGGAGTGTQHYDTCQFILGTNAGGSIDFGTGGQSLLMFDNCTFTFGATGQRFGYRTGMVIVRGGSVGGAALPTTLFTTVGTAGLCRFIGVDLSAFGAGKTLVGVVNAPTVYEFIDCKLGASVAVAAAQTSLSGFRTALINSDSGATGYRQELYGGAGALTTETTIIRTGGASDGVQGISWKVVTTANSLQTAPFESFPILVWNSVVGVAVTLAVELVNDGVTLTNAQAWANVEYLSSASTPLGVLGSSAPATLLTAATNIPTSSAAWNTTGLASPVKQQISVTFTPQMVGFYIVWVNVARASTTLYIDPKVSDGVNPVGRQGIAPVLFTQLGNSPQGRGLLLARGTPF